MKLLRVAMVALSILALGLPVALAQQEQEAENLHVLENEGLIDEMLGALRGLGLPRRGGRGCLHCHVGSMDEPRDTWDFASDTKENKGKARAMFAMVKEINERFLPVVAGDAETHQNVTCYTCHAGRVNPQPLPQLLLSEFEAGGVERLAETYRQARSRYFAADAYDFRIGTLTGVANELTSRGDYVSAAAVHELNIEYYDEPRAHGGLIRTRMVEALSEGGVEAMRARYQQLKGEHPSEAFSPSMLDALGWGLFRSSNREAGVAVFELNMAEHPDAFVSHESLGWAYMQSGQADRGIELAEQWLEHNPGHELGETLLRDLRERS